MICAGRTLIEINMSARQNYPMEADFLNAGPASADCLHNDGHRKGSIMSIRNVIALAVIALIASVSMVSSNAVARPGRGVGGVGGPGVGVGRAGPGVGVGRAGAGVAVGTPVNRGGPVNRVGRR